MKKKLLGLMLCFAITGMTLCSVFSIYADERGLPQSAATVEEAVFAEDITVFVNDKAVGFELPPVIQNGRTLLPVRGVVEAIGGNAEWDEAAQKVTLTYASDIIELTIGSTTAYLNGEEKVLDTAPCIIQSRTLLPIRFVAESFGHKVDWNEETRTVYIAPVYTGEMAEIREKLMEIFDICGGSYINEEYFTKISETMSASEAMEKAVVMSLYMPVSGLDLNLEVGDIHQGGLSYVMDSCEYDEAENTYTINFNCINGQTDKAVLVFDADDNTAVYTGLTTKLPEVQEIKMMHFGFNDDYAEIKHIAYLILKNSPDAKFDGEDICVELDGTEYYLAIHMYAAADSAETYAMFDKGAKGYATFISKDGSMLDSLYYYFIEDDNFEVRDDYDSVLYSAKVK